MGVHGLWKLIESSGKPVPLETLENKVLAVDVSIWLHQAIKGFQDYKGAPVANAHLLGIYHRVCKLLYFKIKPVFVFDGGVPALKRKTIEKRNQYKSKTISEADRLQKQLLNTLLKHSAISKVLSETTKASLNIPKKSSEKYDNLYAIPSSTEFDSTISSSDDEEDIVESTISDSSPTKLWDLHTIDTTSNNFKSLPLEVRHEILTDLKETRKQNSWGKLHQLPKQSDDFSVYQMKRLLKRKEVQSALDEVSQEMGGMSLSLAELESLLKDQGIETTNENIGNRIASDDITRFLYVKNVQELRKAEAKQGTECLTEEDELKKAIQLSLEEIPSTSSYEAVHSSNKSKPELEEDEELQKAIQLETPSTSSYEAVHSSNKSKPELEEEEELQKAIQLETPSTSSYEAVHSSNKSKPELEEEEELQKAIQLETPSTSSYEAVHSSNKSKPELEEEEELQKAIQLSLKDISVSPNDNIPKLSFLKSFNDGDFQSDTDEDYDNSSVSLNQTKKMAPQRMSSAQSYMLEYSGLTPNEIANIINSTTSEHATLHKDTTNLEQEPYKADAIKPKLSKKDHYYYNPVEIMSDSETSSSEVDFSEVPESKPTLEIVIDPYTKNDENDEDLFSDIFVQEAENVKIKTNKLKGGKVEENAISQFKETTIDPSVIDNDRFSDISAEKKSKENIVLGVSTTEKGKDENEDKLPDVVSSNVIIREEPILINTYEVDKKKTDQGIFLSNEKNEITQNTETKISIEPSLPKLTVEQMEEMQHNLQSEKIDLLREKSNKERLGNNITDQMYQEAQELLELFGVPYVIAPMEAEAQCAFLDEVELTDGSITDDSDIWLFGGRTVYKNFFNQSKYVMEFKAENIEHHFKLSRQQLILLALLVGSDYTTGLQGVGPVTALEILATFPPVQTEGFSLSHHQLVSGLKEFKSWFVKGKTPGPGRSALKNKLKNTTVSDNFPSLQVVEAYLEPKVESSRDQFSWNKPDITGLTVFAKEKFGWTMKKTEEILNPVIKKLEENQTQKSIKDYFKTKFKVIPLDLDGKVSKRVKTAIENIGKAPEESIAAEIAELEKETKRALSKTRPNTSETSKKRKRKKKSEEINTVDEKEEYLNDSSSSKYTKVKDAVEINKTQLKKQNTKDKSREKADEEEDLSNKGAGIKASQKRKNKKEKLAETQNSGNGSLEEMSDLKDYENLAVALKNRRKKQNELMKMKKKEPPKKRKIPHTENPVKVPLVENLPKELVNDEEIKLLVATTSQSNRKVEDIKKEALKSLERPSPRKKASVPVSYLHTKEVIQQKLRDKSDLLKNKLKAIEVFRKSKKGPGYVPKRIKMISVAKDDANLSEDSD